MIFRISHSGLDMFVSVPWRATCWNVENEIMRFADCKPFLGINMYQLFFEPNIPRIQGFLSNQNVFFCWQIWWKDHGSWVGGVDRRVWRGWSMVVVVMVRWGRVRSRGRGGVGGKNPSTKGRWVVFSFSKFWEGSKCKWGNGWCFSNWMNLNGLISWLE